MSVKCEKWKVYSVVFCDLFFAFRSILHQGRHSRENSKDFVVYFFGALIKHEIHMKCEKCIVRVSYFVVFRENIRKKIPAKYEMCIAGLTKYREYYPQATLNNRMPHLLNSILSFFDPWRKMFDHLQDTGQFLGIPPFLVVNILMSIILTV